MKTCLHFCTHLERDSVFIVAKNVANEFVERNETYFCAEYPKGSTNSSQGIRGYIFRRVALKFTYFFIKVITYFFFYVIVELL
jgi:hypothetical protein